ncbi:DUF86 domain-containing protein [Methanospirillum sp. J.3.6.1-F.2.7.3]|uniref:DUF86 domain-containing protein n=1 Tax=Methanospirillum purgamenti TaxID=2834276 RepID=A0A8E7AVZ9_9EURY|nr:MULTISPECIES: DUF86 domain-containing protein [Methanospirillum]MDX8551470.1 DUF86 domain-containing protein [Methanospirillum hungatei]QVV88355.1 DUF86 domain-containing protein [Methanospirillum sp. J.3.6.1-F.2.7.3]
MKKIQVIRTDRIRFLLSEIEQSIGLIQENFPQTGNYDDFINLGLLKDGLYKRLEYVLQCIFDICAIINRDLKLGIPQNDDDIIGNLVRSGIINPETGELLKDMKGLRNILVHQYGRINDLIVYDIFMTKMDDISSVVSQLENTLNSHK